MIFGGSDAGTAAVILGLIASQPDRRLCVVCSKVFRADITTCPDDGSMLVLEAGGGEEGGARLGHVIGNYRLQRVLGEGGVGVVYAAEHVRLGRKVAIKLLHPDVVSEEIVQRFFNEARAVNAIRHPNIIDVEDFVTAPTGEHYMVMELLSGQDLRTAIGDEGILDPERVRKIATHIADALAAVHAVGIVHRDLKPDNIFLTMKDGAEVAKLLDFGIAKFSDTHGLTRAGMTMGTPEYMAPEQILTDGTPGPAGDLYALGMVMYEALAGAPAFTATTTAAILRAHCYEKPAPPSDRRGEAMPQSLEAIVMRCLEKSPADRFASATELAAALRGQVVATRLPTKRPATAPHRSPRRALIMMPAFAMAAAALFLHLSVIRGAGEPEIRRSQTTGAATASPSAVHPVAPKPDVRTAPVPVPPPPPPSAGSADLRTTGSATATVQIGLVSEPAGAELFVGEDLRALGPAPVTASLAAGSDPVDLVARWPDGVEVRETLVPDHAIRELRLVKPVAAPQVPHLTRHGTNKRTNGSNDTDRDGTLDPFRK
jgi:serine/threonine protein kinase